MNYELHGRNYKIGIAQWCLKSQGSGAVREASKLGFNCIQLETYFPGEKYYIGHDYVIESYRLASMQTNVTLCALALNVIEKIGIVDTFDMDDNSRLSVIIRDSIQAASLLNIPLLYIPNFKESEIKNDNALSSVSQIFKSVCLLAQQYDITVATENTLNFRNTAKLITLVNETNFKVLIDIYNPLLWGHSVCEIIRYNHPYIADQLHIKDGINGIMGNARLGEGDSPPLYEIFKEIHYPINQYTYIFENDYQTNAFSFVKQDMATFLGHLELFVSSFELKKEMYNG